MPEWNGLAVGQLSQSRTPTRRSGGAQPVDFDVCLSVVITPRCSESDPRLSPQVAQVALKMALYPARCHVSAGYLELLYPITALH